MRAKILVLLLDRDFLLHWSSELLFFNAANKKIKAYFYLVLDSQIREKIYMDGYYPIEMMTYQNPNTELNDSEVNCDPQAQNVSETPLNVPQESNIDENLNLGDTFLVSPGSQILSVSDRPWVENPSGSRDRKEPKMCNEETATYWTGGGGDSHQQNDVLTSDSVKIDDKDGKTGQRETYPRMYFPLEKTLRNHQLLDLKLQYNTCQTLGNKKYCECSNDTSSSSDESNAKFPEPRKQCRNQEDTEQVHNLAMITLLSECHLKLQHLEELKHYSGYLAHSLWEARETISFLKENVAALRHENKQKENEIFNLSKELLDLKRLLYEKSARITDMKAVFKSLDDHLHSRSTQQTIATCPDGDCPAHSAVKGPVATDPEMINLGNSRICIIL